MSTETAVEVTLEEPAVYFAMLDRASSEHWWSRSVEYVERRWIRSQIADDVSQGRRRWDWLDVGCGTGSRLRTWYGWGLWGHCTGVEPEPSALADAPNHKGIELLPGTLPGLCIRNRKFDLITALDVIQHVPVEQRELSLAELAESLNPGGLLLLRTNAPPCFGDSNADATVIDPLRLRRFLVSLGMNIVRQSRFNAIGSVWEDLVRQFSRRGTKKGPMKTGLPRSWSERPKGHPAARWAGFVESRILGTGLVKFPFGHSYLILASKDESNERSANG